MALSLQADWRGSYPRGWALAGGTPTLAAVGPLSAVGRGTARLRDQTANLEFVSGDDITQSCRLLLPQFRFKWPDNRYWLIQVDSTVPIWDIRKGQMCYYYWSHLSVREHTTKGTENVFHFYLVLIKVEVVVWGKQWTQVAPGTSPGATVSQWLSSWHGQRPAENYKSCRAEMQSMYSAWMEEMRDQLHHICGMGPDKLPGMSPEM